VKHVVCVPDGCADSPQPELDGRTPLEVARMPTLHRLAARSEVGRATVIPPGLPAGSDVGNMSILGYDPVRYHTGRAPIEAAAMGLRLGPDRVAYRCNLVTIDDDGVMVDFAGGHPSTPEAAEMIRAVDAALGAGAGAELSFHPGVQYRHVMVASAEWSAAECTPPHDLADRTVVGPSGPAAPKLQAVMEASRPIVSGFGREANQVWLWGQGFQPVMPAFRSVFGVDAALCTAVDLVRGLGVLTGIEVVEVEGATGWLDTAYENKRDAALRALEAGADVFVIHVEATDEASHAGDLAAKIEALEAWDHRILAGLIDGLDALGPWRLLLVPDHHTPVHLKTHTADPVPYLLVDSSVDLGGGVYSEPATVHATPRRGAELMARLLEGPPP
jgi:2,3-bisphosphoglycerate-independent phosphoglycerate mutase